MSNNYAKRTNGQIKREIVQVLRASGALTVEEVASRVNLNFILVDWLADELVRERLVVRLP